MNMGQGKEKTLTLLVPSKCKQEVLTGNLRGPAHEVRDRPPGTDSLTPVGRAGETTESEMNS